MNYFLTTFTAVLWPCIAFANNTTLQQSGWTITLSPSGDMVSVIDGHGCELAQSRCGSNRVAVAVIPAGKTAADLTDQDLVVCDKPARRQDATGGALFEYDLTPQMPLKVMYKVEFAVISGWAGLKRTVTLVPASPPLTSDVMLVVGNNLRPSAKEHRVFMPRYNGRGEELENTPGRQWLWNLNGGGRMLPGASEQLSIPMISDAGGSPAVRLTHIADPFFTTSFRIADPASKRNGEFACVYPASKVPMREPMERTFWTVIQTGEPAKAMGAWYATALADVPAGPGWLHEVAWQHYDYLSHGGKGWFEDIDAAEKLVPREDRAKVVFTLHGWYGLLGRYAFDENAGKLDDEWMAFSNAAAMKDKGFPTNESVKMSRAEMHRRIRYAKDRGFRVCLYFADGLNACDGVKEIFSPEQVLAWGGWVGPDTLGKTYQRNPAHPRVYAWYVNYLKALLAEYGSEIDALVWDETFLVKAGAGIDAPMPGYSASAMMRLVRELTQMCTKFRPSLAFLSSDCAGVSFDGKSFWLDVPCYAIMSHGCYQDSHCEPGTWPYGIFPNYRNTMWSCNWSAVTRFDYTKFGVEHYTTPVATTNGWLDDKGIARLSEAERAAVVELFNKRKTQRQQLKWLTGPAPQFK